MDVASEDGWVRYTSRRRPSEGVHADLTAPYRPTGPVFAAQPGSLDYFLTERYCLYTVDDAFRLHRLEIHHPPWPLQAAEATIEVNYDG